MKTYIRRQQHKNLNTKTQKRTTTEVSPWNDHLYKTTGGLKSILHGHNLPHPQHLEWFITFS